MDHKLRFELEETELEKVFFQLWGYVNRQDLGEDVNAGGWGNPKSRIDTEDDDAAWQVDKTVVGGRSDPKGNRTGIGFVNGRNHFWS